MFDLLSGVTAAWREIIHVSEWTGISVGVLVGLGVLAYLDPAARKIAIRCAIAIVIGYALVMYGNRVGAADKQAQWDAANAKDAADHKKRDADQASAAGSDAATRSANLDANKKSDQEIVDALRKADAVCRPISLDELR